MYNLILLLLSVILINVSSLTFAVEEKLSHSKVLLLTENSLQKEFKNLDKRFSNALSARLADVRMGVITPYTTTRGVNSNNQQKILPSYKELEKNNKITFARQLGADAILSVNIDEFTSTRAEIPKFDRTVVTFKLVTNYQFISSAQKSALGGESIIVEKKIPLTSQVGLSASENTILSELLDQAAEMVSKSILNSELWKQRWHRNSRTLQKANLTVL